MRRLSLLCFISFLPSLCELLGSRSVLPPSSPRAVRRRRAASGRMRRRHVGEGALVLGAGAMAGSRWRARAATHARPAHFLRTHRRGTAAFDACAPCFALRMMGARVSEPRTLRTRSCCASSRAAESVLAPALRYAYAYPRCLLPCSLRIMHLVLVLLSCLVLLHPRDALHSAYPRTSYTCMYMYHISVHAHAQYALFAFPSVRVSESRPSPSRVVRGARMNVYLRGGKSCASERINTDPNTEARESWKWAHARNEKASKEKLARRLCCTCTELERQRALRVRVSSASLD
ncbi:hypothetical protein DFH09DRAFT_1209841 [Mycena vulgaris]|nr:hypothetical protein DFH09DRAFT_1209841 [Mycena vulgaris]